jgi:hypothetical protein
MDDSVTQTAIFAKKTPSLLSGCGKACQKAGKPRRFFANDASKAVNLCQRSGFW